MFRPLLRGTGAVFTPRLRGIVTQAKLFQSIGDNERTITRVLNQELDVGLMVDSYSQTGFRLNNGMSVIGPIALFPKTVLSWRVRSSADITEDTLSLFCLLEPKLDILVIGVGDRGSPVNPRVLQYMRNKRVNIEILPTESACTTFNFLNEERRCVAAALLPPLNLRSSEADLVRTQVRRNEFSKSRLEEDNV